MTNTNGKVSKPKIRGTVITAIFESPNPCDIEYVRKRAGLGWGTARAILLDLLLQGKIAGARTSKGWIFYKPGEFKEVMVQAP